MLSNIILRLTKQGRKHGRMLTHSRKEKIRLSRKMVQSWFYDQPKKPTSWQRILHILLWKSAVVQNKLWKSMSFCWLFGPGLCDYSLSAFNAATTPPQFHSQRFQGTARSSLSWPRRQIRGRSFESWLSLQKIVWTRVVCRGLFPTWDNHLPTLWRLHIVLNTSIYKPQKNYDQDALSCLIFWPSTQKTHWISRSDR